PLIFLLWPLICIVTTSEEEINPSQKASYDPQHRNDSSISKIEPSMIFYVYNSVLLILLSLVIIGSLLDYATAESEKERIGGHVWNALMSFSLPRNSLSIFSLQQGRDAINCLDGIRVISFAWVATGHTLKVFIDKG
ncbi:hypothetical protein PMAYCL1PPCAC_16509, partial [Pristionchus mayeri]